MTYLPDHNAHVEDGKFVAALRAPNYAYSRNRMGAVWAYGYDATPTGVRLICGHADIARANELIDLVGRAFPLSPTEGLNKSGAAA